MAHIYSQRWAIESAFETMKAWGLDQFMVRQWAAIERLVWIVAVAYAVATLALYERAMTRFREQAYGVLRRWSAVKRWLTVGKVAEALGYDYHHHTRAWTGVWIQ